MDFRAVYGENPLLEISAHGRVNLLGEHTDYNNGFVLPMLLDSYTTICVAVDSAKPKNAITLCSDFDGYVLYTRNISDVAQGHWSDYVVGVLAEMQHMLTEKARQILEAREKQSSKQQENLAMPKIEFPHLLCKIQSTIPTGAGLSSSAALEIATAKSIRALCEHAEYGFLSEIFAITFPLNLDTNTNLDASSNTTFSKNNRIIDMWNDVEIAKLCQRVENNYIGLPCGLMDQLVISIGRQRQALKIDFFEMDQPRFEFVDLLEGMCFLIIYSGISHKLLQSGDEGYSTRVAQCKSASEKLGVAHLSEIADEEIGRVQNCTELSAVERNRAQHIISENERVSKAVNALAKKDVMRFALCMNESHESQRDLFEVSIPEIDALVQTAREAGALGARLTGGGFGGSIIALVEPAHAEHVWQTIHGHDPQASLLQKISI